MDYKDFSYVNDLLSGVDYRSVYLNGRNNTLRDSLFTEVLDSFNGKPVKIFQIGAIESLEGKFRIGSGWSDLFWGNYVKKHGGSLLIVDLDLNHIAHSAFLANAMSYTARFHCGDANSVIVKGFDIYYLDGADISYSPDAYQQTLNQFKKIENEKSIVVVDDMPTKGVELKKYVIPLSAEKGWTVKEYDFGNGMMTIDMR